MLKWLIVETVAAITWRIAASSAEAGGEAAQTRSTRGMPSAARCERQRVEPCAEALRAATERGGGADRALDDQEADDEGRDRRETSATRAAGGGRRRARGRPRGDGVEHEPDDQRLDHRQEHPGAEMQGMTTTKAMPIARQAREQRGDRGSGGRRRPHQASAPHGSDPFEQGCRGRRSSACRCRRGAPPNAWAARGPRRAAWSGTPTPR